MKTFHDFTNVPALQSFPWEPTYRGLANSGKAVTTYYGDVHSREYRHTDKGWPDKNSWRWYNALKHGVDVEGFNVNVTHFGGDFWWARMHEPNVWTPTHNHKLFPDMHQWIAQSGIFAHTGRIVFFIQLQGQRSPIHTDFDPLGVPEHLRAPTDFIWLTPPDAPKALSFADGVALPWACWFNHFIPHGSAAQDRPNWSLRIDGVFTNEFRQKFASA